jgi:UDP:flavonoid glycosyltransferase YjiC (YdhE family)
MRAAVEEILGEPRFGANARRIAAALAEAPGPAGAADLLQELAGAAGRAEATPAPERSLT